MDVARGLYRYEETLIWVDGGSSVLVSAPDTPVVLYLVVDLRDPHRSRKTEHVLLSEFMENAELLYDASDEYRRHRATS